VITDSGSIGGFTMTNAGISGGTATILITKIPNAQSQMLNVNGTPITPEPVSVPEASEAPVTLLVTHTTGDNYSLALMPATYDKAVGGTVGAQAILAFDQTAGSAPSITPKQFNTTGAITSLVSNLNPTYDFSPFGAPGGTINFTFTATTFTGAGVNSFASLFTHAGATATGSGAFSQIAVPEPASMSLLGIGMSGFFALRRFFKRPSVV
jgi:hypothetical protein